jgi:outer membrane biosynthesis protein TonB
MTDEHHLSSKASAARKAAVLQPPPRCRRVDPSLASAPADLGHLCRRIGSHIFHGVRPAAAWRDVGQAPGDAWYAVAEDDAFTVLVVADGVPGSSFGYTATQSIDEVASHVLGHVSGADDLGAALSMALAQCLAPQARLATMVRDQALTEHATWAASLQGPGRDRAAEERARLEADGARMALAVAAVDRRDRRVAVWRTCGTRVYLETLAGQLWDLAVGPEDAPTWSSWHGIGAGAPQCVVVDQVRFILLASPGVAPLLGEGRDGLLRVTSVTADDLHRMHFDRDATWLLWSPMYVFPAGGSFATVGGSVNGAAAVPAEGEAARGQRPATELMYAINPAQEDRTELLNAPAGQDDHTEMFKVELPASLTSSKTRAPKPKAARGDRFLVLGAIALMLVSVGFLALFVLDGNKGRRRIDPGLSAMGARGAAPPYEAGGDREAGSGGRTMGSETGGLGGPPPQPAGTETVTGTDTVTVTATGPIGPPGGETEAGTVTGTVTETAQAEAAPPVEKPASEPAAPEKPAVVQMPTPVEKSASEARTLPAPVAKAAAAAPKPAPTTPKAATAAKAAPAPAQAAAKGTPQDPCASQGWSDALVSACSSSHPLAADAPELAGLGAVVVRANVAPSGAVDSLTFSPSSVARAGFGQCLRDKVRQAVSFPTAPRFHECSWVVRP